MDKLEVGRLIKQYEPMMHKLLHKFKVKRDYEDNLQELRITAWNAILKYELNKKEGRAQGDFDAYIYKSLKNKLTDIVCRINYRCIKDSDDEEQEIRGSVSFYIRNPHYYDELDPLEKGVIMVREDKNTTDIRLKMDTDLFYESLEDLEKAIINLRVQHMTQRQIADELGLSQFIVFQNLKNIRRKLDSFLNS